MTADPRLFDVPGPEPDPDLSYTRKLTIRRRAKLDAGIHPNMGGPLRPDLGTCGDCAHHLVRRLGHTYHKCALNETCGPATDILVSWPACERWEAET